MPDESDDYEEKSSFDFKFGQEYDIVKTMVAFANTRGGKIAIKSPLCDPKRLDSAKLDDLVNRFVSPRLSGISSSVSADGACEISVSKSNAAPHVFAKYQSFKNEVGEDRTAWQAGLVVVRHSSKTTAAVAEDIHRLIAERLQAILSALAGSIAKFGTKIVDDPTAIPIKITNSPDSLELTVTDFNVLYPYTADAIGKLIGKSKSWVASAVRKLSLFGNKNFHNQINGYKLPTHRYSDACVVSLRATLSENPDFDPFHP